MRASLLSNYMESMMSCKALVFAKEFLINGTFVGFGTLMVDVTRGLLEALFTTFFVIFIGYLLGKADALDRDGRKTVGLLLVKIVLPALILKAMATLDFSNVRWLLVLGVALAKMAVVSVVAIATVATNRMHPASIAQGGLRSILSVQSNDFALGLPILSALYPMELTEYLYLFAPINFLLVYPVALSLLEYGTRKSGTRMPSRFGFGITIFISILRNPVLIATLVGVALNFIFNQRLPSLIEHPLSLIGSAFNSLALLNLGASMVGKSSQLKGHNLMKAIGIVLAKSILLPILIALILSSLGENEVMLPKLGTDTAQKSNQTLFPKMTDNWQELSVPGNNTSYDKYYLNLFGFIYGTFPSAPGALPFAQQYGVDIDLAAASVVLGTVVAAPLMFISAKMATISVSKSKADSLEANGNACDICKPFHLTVFGVFCVWSDILYLISLRYKSTKDCLYVVYIVYCIGIGIIINTCQIDATAASARARFSISWFFIYATRVTSVLIAFVIMEETTAHRFFSRLLTCPRHVMVFITLYRVVVSTNLREHITTAFSNVRLPGDGYKCSLSIQASSFYVSLAISALCAVILAGIITTIATFGIQGSLERSTLVQEEGSESLMQLSISRTSPSVNHTITIETDAVHCQRSENVVAFEETVVSENSSLQVIEEATPLLSHHENDQAATQSVHVGFSCLIGLGSCLWTVTTAHESGVYFEILFLDDALLHSQGLAVLACLGFKSEYWNSVTALMMPIIAATRTVLYNTEPVIVYNSDEELHHELLRPHVQEILIEAKNVLVKPRQYRLRTYCDVIVGHELVTYLCEYGVAMSRKHAVTIGRALVAHGILVHVTQEHHFHDRHYFYKWNSARFNDVLVGDEQPETLHGDEERQ
eukprot:gene5481-7181_t